MALERRADDRTGEPETDPTEELVVGTELALESCSLGKKKKSEKVSVFILGIQLDEKC